MTYSFKKKNYRHKHCKVIYFTHFFAVQVKVQVTQRWIRNEWAWIYNTQNEFPVILFRKQKFAYFFSFGNSVQNQSSASSSLILHLKAPDYHACSFEIFSLTFKFSDARCNSKLMVRFHTLSVLSLVLHETSFFLSGSFSAVSSCLSNFLASVPDEKITKETKVVLWFKMYWTHKINYVRSYGYRCVARMSPSAYKIMCLA